jgi:hypothetical protein
LVRKSHICCGLNCFFANEKYNSGGCLWQSNRHHKHGKTQHSRCSVFDSNGSANSRRWRTPDSRRVLEVSHSSCK